MMKCEWCTEERETPFTWDLESLLETVVLEMIKEMGGILAELYVRKGNLKTDP